MMRDRRIPVFLNMREPRFKYAVQYISTRHFVVPQWFRETAVDPERLSEARMVPDWIRKRNSSGPERVQPSAEGVRAYILHRIFESGLPHI